MIVSRGPPPASEPLPVSPSLPNAAAARLLSLKASNDTPSGIGTAGFTSTVARTATRLTDDAAILAASLSVRGVSQTGNKPVQNWKALWDYLQSFMTRHKGPSLPDTGWVRELVTLPQVRNLEWNMLRQAQHPFLDSKPRDVSSLILQVTGEVAPQPCSRCLAGKGPFEGCVMIAREAHWQPLKKVFSCANCFYHYNQT